MYFEEILKEKRNDAYYKLALINIGELSRCIVEYPEAKLQEYKIIDKNNRIIYADSHYTYSNSSSGYTIDCDGIIESYYNNKTVKAKLSDEDLKLLKELISLIKVNYKKNINPESIINPGTPKSKIGLYNDYGIIEKKIYIENNEVILYQYGDVMGYNDTKETKEIIKLTESLYKKYINA